MRLYLYISAFFLLFLETACERDLPLYEGKICQLNFKYGNNYLSPAEMTDQKRTVFYSFILNANKETQVDTVWVTVASMGYLSNKNRSFELKQIATGDHDAIENEHYVSFDDPSLKSKYYFLPANQAEVKIAVVLKRAPSLAINGDVKLKFTFKENENFKLGYTGFGEFNIVISDRLSKPKMWDNCSLDSYFGTYGSKKHELMISWTQKSWDDAYISSLFYSIDFGDGGIHWWAKDGNYIGYLSKWFSQRLEEENKLRLSDPSIRDIYREKNGEAVDFTHDK